MRSIEHKIACDQMRRAQAGMQEVLRLMIDTAQSRASIAAGEVLDAINRIVAVVEGVWPVDKHQDHEDAKKGTLHKLVKEHGVEHHDDLHDEWHEFGKQHGGGYLHADDVNVKHFHVWRARRDDDARKLERDNHAPVYLRELHDNGHKVVDLLGADESGPARTSAETLRLWWAFCDALKVNIQYPTPEAVTQFQDWLDKAAEAAARGEDG